MAAKAAPLTITKPICVVIVMVLPFALFASAARLYMRPIGLAVMTMMMSNQVVVLGRGEYFPWAVPINN